MSLQVWTAERSTQLGMAVSSMLKGYTTTAAQIITAMLKSVTKFTIQVGTGDRMWQLEKLASTCRTCAYVTGAKFGREEAPVLHRMDPQCCFCMYSFNGCRMLQVGVAMIFGFFMLWDLPTITAGVSSLSKSRLAPLYAELSPVMSVFGKLFGRALEAQARIALVNTALTAIGMWLLAIPGIGLLSMFVFICSFIPIAGVIISTTPIGFVALTEYGFIKLALVIIMVTAVHFVEVRAGC